MFGRAPITLGLWLVKVGTQTSGRTQYVRIPATDPPPLVTFHVTCPDRGWTYSYNTEPEARSFVEAYYCLEDRQPELQVTRVVNGYNDETVTVTKSTFAPDVPLFPLEASAN